MPKTFIYHFATSFSIFFILSHLTIRKNEPFVQQDIYTLLSKIHSNIIRYNILNMKGAIWI